MLINQMLELIKIIDLGINIIGSGLDQVEIGKIVILLKYFGFVFKFLKARSLLYNNNDPHIIIILHKILCLRSINSLTLGITLVVEAPRMLSMVN